MEFSRRGFLTLMGLSGTAVAAVGPSVFSLGDPSRILGSTGHFVFGHEVSPILAPGAKAHYLSPPDEHGPGFVILMREPLPRYSWATNNPIEYVGYSNRRSKFCRPSVGWTPIGEPLSYEVNCVVPEGEDPHIAFFMAAAELQNKISRDAQELVKVSRSESLVFVTKVDSPIMAYPHPDRGFFLGTQLSQFAVLQEDLINADLALSSRGEVPVEAPEYISFKYLMGMEAELRKRGMLNENLYRAPRGAFNKAFQVARS